MTIAEIKEFVQNQILQSLDGGSGIENNKMDFKREWHQLTEQDGQSKFLVDVCAIVNSYGGGDGFLVIGYDEKSKIFHSSPFSITKLRDSSDLIGIIKRKVDRPFNLQLIEMEFIDNGINKSILSIIHIPPSLDKPHVIRNLFLESREHLNEIFVRKGDRNDRASKADLDLMYAEKGNIIVDRKALVGLRMSKFRFRSEAYYNGSRITSNNNIFLDTEFSLENLGYRTLAMNTVELKINLKIQRSEKVTSLVMPYSFVTDRLNNDKSIVKPNSIQIFHLTLAQRLDKLNEEESKKFCDLLNDFLFDETKVEFSSMKFILSNGEILIPEIRVVNV
jgi:Putative DNA-binding domain